MEKMVSYVFGALHNAEQSINDINKFIKKQSGVNTRLAIANCLVVGSFLLLAAKVQSQDDEISSLKSDVIDLTDEIGELKDLKGE